MLIMGFGPRHADEFVRHAAEFDLKPMINSVGGGEGA